MNRWTRVIILALMLLVALAFYLMPKDKPQEERRGFSGRAAEKTAETAQALQRLHCTLAVPPGMTVAREAPGFLWLTDNGTGIMRGICLYCYPAEAIDTALVVRKRDSVMRQNLPGEEPQMHIQTERRLPVSHEWTAAGVLRSRGSWEMEGDMMGGPFVCHSRLDKKRGRVVVAEAFIYAPGREKEVPLQRLEEALLTLKTEETQQAP